MLPVLVSMLIFQGEVSSDFVKVRFPEGKRYVYTKKTTVYFDFDSHNVREEEAKKLELFKEKERVMVSGFASPEGRKFYNYSLSEKRAKEVADLLRKRGVRVIYIKPEGEDHCWVPRKEFYPECRKVEVEEFHGQEGFDLP